MLLISTHNNHILAKIGRGISTELFNFILSTLKLHGCEYRSKTMDWRVNPAAYEDIIETIEEEVEVKVENQAAIDAILCPPVMVKKERLEFTRADLKVQPLVGKHPYERFQLEDLMCLTTFNRFALYNEMGTGKSYELLTAYDLRRRFQGIKKLVYVTASTGVINAKNELLKFTGVKEEEITIGNKDNRRPFDSDYNIIIMNYRSFLLISDEYQKDIDPNIKDYRKTPIPIKKWLNNQEGMLITDESHNISNPSARQSKAIDLVKNFFEYRYIATGTPADIELKFYNQLKLLDGALVRNLSYTAWKERYYNMGTKYSEYEPSSFKEHMKEELQKYIKMYSVRRFAEDVLVIPPMTIKPIYVEMSPLHKTIYENSSVATLNSIAVKGSIHRDDLKNSFSTLLLSLDCPDLLLKHEDIANSKLASTIKKFKFKDHAKVEVLLDILKENEGEKIIIWCSHPHTGFQLQELLKEYKPLVLNGETSPPKGMGLDEYKHYIKDIFCSKDGPNILIAGFQVLNSSVTMIECSKQIIFEATYNFIEYQQALKRIHRAGQTKMVTGYYLIYDNSIDVARKKNLEDKDFLNNNFYSDKYIELSNLVELFNMKGEV